MSTSVLRHRRYPAWLAAGLISCLSIGCALGGGSTYPEGAPAGEAVDVPERFVSEDMPEGAAVTDTLPGPGCRSPLLDPRDGTRLQMVNSQQRVGDYAPPEGRYGVGPGELLRVECNTGRVVGVVPDRSPPGALPGRAADRGAGELRDRESSFFTALTDRDAERVATHFADDAMLHIADMPPMQGRDAIGTFYSNLLRYLSATTSISETLRVSDSGDMAYTTGSVTNVFEGGDGRVEYPGKYLVVWERPGTEWEIVLYAVSSNQSEADEAG